MNVNPYSSGLNLGSLGVEASTQRLENACLKNWRVWRTRETTDIKNRVFQFSKYIHSCISCGSQIDGTKSPLEENKMAVTCWWPQNVKFSVCSSWWTLQVQKIIINCQHQIFFIFFYNAHLYFHTANSSIYVKHLYLWYVIEATGAGSQNHVQAIIQLQIIYTVFLGAIPCLRQ